MISVDGITIRRKEILPKIFLPELLMIFQPPGDVRVAENRSQLLPL